MTRAERTEFENMVIKCKDEAVYYYNRGNHKQGKKYEKMMKYFQKLVEEADKDSK